MSVGILLVIDKKLLIKSMNMCVLTTWPRMESASVQYVSVYQNGYCVSLIHFFFLVFYMLC